MKQDISEKILVEELFKKSISNGAVRDEKIIKVDKLTGDASTRRYYRVFSETTTYVVCLDEPVKDSKDTKNEPSFVTLQRVLHAEGVRVPLIYDKDLSLGYLLEEDLGDQTFIKEIAKIKTNEEEYAFYKEAIDLIIRFHQISLSKYSNESFTQIAFDTTKLFQEMEFTKKYFLSKLFSVNAEDPAVLKLNAKLLDVCEELSAQKKVLVHRDYHSRNLMFKGEEQVVIDFQDARMGTPLYDLVSLLEDCYYDLNQENRNGLKKYYYDTFFSHFDKKSYEEYLRLYDLMSVQRVYKAIGSFSYIYADRKDIRYLKHIGFAFEKLRKIMSAHPELAEAKKVLSGIYYAN